jgi:hypothetical protein
MKNLRQLSAGLILILVFTVTVFAGDIDCPVTAPQLPTTTTQGDMNYPAIQLAVSIIQSVLSLS